MKAVLMKPAVDIGVVVADPDPMVAFYRDLLGFEDLGSVTVPGFGDFHRLGCGESTIKLLLPERPAAAADHAGGFSGTRGLRYFTLSVSNLDEIIEAAATSGVKFAVPVTPLGRIRMAMLEDPEGNAVELLEMSSPE